MRISALIAGSCAALCMADLGVTGGLGSTPSDAPAPDASNEPAPAPIEPDATVTKTDPAANTEPAPPKAAAKKAAAKKADSPAATSLANEVASALTSGDWSAVVWAMPGHEAYRPGAVVVVDKDTYGRLRDKGHARDCEQSELEAAIDAGAVFWDH